MISGYLMALKAERDHTLPLGRATTSFLLHKWLGLIPYLLPAALIGFGVTTYLSHFPWNEIPRKILLLVFEIFPANTAGFGVGYYLGISWYLSSMFAALALLYPLYRKFSSDISLLLFPVSIGIYGLISHVQGNIATYDWLGNFPFYNMGVLRGIAGCLLGCVLFRCAADLRKKKLSRAGRVFFAVSELFCYFLFFYLMERYPKSNFDFFQIILIFVFLLIGLSGYSVFEGLLQRINTKALGTLSTLLVLNHYCFARLAEYLYAGNSSKMIFLLYYSVGIAVSSLIGYIFSKLLQSIIQRFPKWIIAVNSDPSCSEKE